MLRRLILRRLSLMTRWSFNPILSMHFAFSMLSIVILGIIIVLIRKLLILIIGVYSLLNKGN